MDPFDQWESEFADDENERVHRILADHAAWTPEGSGNECQLEWDTPVKRCWRRD